MAKQVLKTDCVFLKTMSPTNQMVNKPAKAEGKRMAHSVSPKHFMDNTCNHIIKGGLVLYKSG
jgi:hypothetical protein